MFYDNFICVFAHQSLATTTHPVKIANTSNSNQACNNSNIHWYCKSYNANKSNKFVCNNNSYQSSTKAIGCVKQYNVRQAVKILMIKLQITQCHTKNSKQQNFDKCTKQIELFIADKHNIVISACYIFSKRSYYYSQNKPTNNSKHKAQQQSFMLFNITF